MEYSTYKKIAEMYVIENKDTLDVLKTYNKDFEDKIYQHMLNLMLKNHNQNGNELKETVNKNKAYWKRFIEDYRK